MQGTGGIAMDLTLLIAFGASFFLVALSPGLCMTLAMSLGISIGVRRTIWMMVGELTGIALVGAFAVLGVATLLLNAPTVFAVFKWIGAAYLLYMGWQTWRAEPLRPEQLTGDNRRTRSSLILQGFITAIANPKAWAFFVALLPPFIDQSRPLAPQLLALLALMLIIEFTCLQIYAHGGRALSEQLHRRGKARWLNRIAGSLMVGVGVWLALG
ncbi:MAG: LysE family translocator [Xanthomonadaceae bacterium]|nr:LysE family translocator [Xanthomonadaceae bacterium]